MAIKVAVIGAGSLSFTRTLVSDILSVPELTDTTFALMDIAAENLDRVRGLIQRDIDAAGISAKLEAHSSQREAIRDANYVICCVRVGGLEAFQTDVDIPLKYGIDQCVGDTLGPGGIFYGQRGIPVMLGICQDIRETAPNALLINYSNPMAMLTWACAEFGGVNVVGLCHGVQGGHHQIAEVIQHCAREDGVIGPDEAVTMKDVDIICAGINHQTWYTRVIWRGQDMIPTLLDGFRRHPKYQNTEKVRIDMMERFGLYSTESNGHLSEYVPWYRKRTEEIPRWIDLSFWIHGETGGYLRVCREGRNWFETEYPKLLEEPPRVSDPAKRSQEHGSWIIESLETGRIYRGHFNVVNRGVIPNLPPDCVIEAPGYVDRNGISTPVVGDLPLGCAAVCNASISVQRMAVRAAVSGDDLLLRQALMMDPLTGAVANPPEIWQMADEMLVAGEAWLPQYGPAIAQAKERMKGDLIPTLTTRGAARLESTL